MSAKLVSQNAESIQPGDEEGLRVLLEALISCGVAMSIAGSSRPASGSEHLFSHALDNIEGHAMHGEQCGIGAIMIAYLYNANWKRIRDTLKQIGAPTTARAINVKDEDVVKALEYATTIRPERYTILHKLKLVPRFLSKSGKNHGDNRIINLKKTVFHFGKLLKPYPVRNKLLL